MAFLSKMGNVLKQSAAKHINLNISSSSLSIFQAIRCMSCSKLFIGGLSYSTDDQSLSEAFGNYGEVVEARVIMDRESGRSKGFGFITYTSAESASSAIQALDGQDLHGRQVRVNYATDRARTGGFGGGDSGGYGRGRGYGGGGYNEGGSYSSGGGGGGYGGGNTMGSGSSGTFDNFGIAGGSGGPSSNDSYVSGATSAELGGADQFGPTGAGGFNQSNPSEGNFRDEDDNDETDNFAKRA